MKRRLCVVAAGLALLCCTSAGAAEGGQVVFRDTMYGVLTGALVGGALTLATDKPQDHLAWVGVGAAVGAVAGVIYGTYETTAVAELDADGHLQLAVPTIRLQGTLAALEPSVEVLRVRF